MQEADTGAGVMKAAADTRDNGAAGRRGLLKRAGLGVAGAAALSAGALGGMGLTARPARADTALDVDILNFALNLEYLEANYYLLAATGQGLSSGDTGGSSTPGMVTGGSAVPFQLPIIQQYANNIAVDELAHVRFLRTALNAAGGTNTAVAQPTIDLQTSFTNLAVAAGLISQGQSFNPFADEISFLLGAFIFEDVGVSAYAGAARYISDPDYIEAAGAILAIEAYHAGTIRTLLASIGAGVAVDKISSLRAKLSGVDDDEGILMPSGAVNIAPADSNALAFRRTPQQVLNIVYFQQNATSGGFFPNGVNGALT